MSLSSTSTFSASPSLLLISSRNNFLMADQKPVALSPLIPSKYSQRVLLKNILERSDGGSEILGHRVVVGGWVKSAKEVRKEPVPLPSEKKNMYGGSNKDASCVEILQSRIPIFRSLVKVLCGTNINYREKSEAVPKQPPQSISILTVSDGSCVAGLQIIVDSSLALPSQLLPTGTCILAEGTLKKPSTPGKQLIELIAESILHIGIVDQNQYPLSTKRVPIEKLKDWSHFRPRTTTVGSVTRIRSGMTFAVHSFFQNNGFFYVQLPTITTTSAEGFGTKFLVTTLDRKEAEEEQQRHPNKVEGLDLDAVRAAVTEKSNLVEKLKRTDSNKEALVAAMKDLEKTNELVSTVEAREKLKSEPPMKGDNMNFSEDFFSRQTYLTVSGRLHLESYACALGNVYSCGPRFRADRIESSKQSAEMWMVETEIAFSQMEDAIKCADDLLKFLCKWVLEDCSEDMKFVTKRIDKTNIARLQSTISSSLEKISYSETVDIFKKIADKNSEMALEWGAALTTEHLSYLADEIYKKPLIIHDYPKEVQPFYVRLNDDGKTVAAFDLIVPKAGRVISGSQNEERLDMFRKRIEQLNLPKEEYEWCLQLRQHGTVKHSGFSLALDSFLVFATGLPDVRQATPFPRSFGEAKN